MAYMGHVRTNLMSSSGQQFDFCKRITFAVVQYSVLCEDSPCFGSGRVKDTDYTFIWTAQ